MSFYLLIQKNFVPLHSLLKRSVRDLAQLVAHTSGGREVAGSSPVIPTERERLTKVSLFFFLYVPYTLFIYMETATITLAVLFQ